MPMIPAPRFSAGAPLMKFIFGEPMKPTTNRPFGRL
jgi:hypothetical protein